MASARSSSARVALGFGVRASSSPEARCATSTPTASWTSPSIRRAIPARSCPRPASEALPTALAAHAGLLNRWRTKRGIAEGRGPIAGLRPLRLLPFFLVLLRSFTEVSVQEVFSEVRQEKYNRRNALLEVAHL